MHYNYTSPAYHPERRIRDSSHVRPGWVDSYEIKAPVVVPQPSPEPPKPGEATKAENPDALDPKSNATDSTNSTTSTPLQAADSANP
jgi:hypothetical protein